MWRRTGTILARKRLATSSSILLCSTGAKPLEELVIAFVDAHHCQTWGGSRQQRACYSAVVFSIDHCSNFGTRSRVPDTCVVIKPWIEEQRNKTMVFGRSNRPLPQGEDDPNSYTISQQQSLVSLSELNSLLESALRMSGDDAASMLGGNNASASATATYPPPPPANITDDSESTSSSWRLDTTRKLTAVSMI